MRHVLSIIVLFLRGDLWSATLPRRGHDLNRPRRGHDPNRFDSGSCPRSLLILLTAMFALPVFAREWRDIRNEADRDLPPRMQYYNKLKGKPKLLPWETDDPESLNVRLVGKWGRGPAASVTGRDTLIYLGLGSEVAIFNASDGSNPRIINEIQCRYVVDRVILKDNLLYAVLQGGIEVFDITDPARAFRIKYLPISVVDMCIRDTLAYTIDADSFKVYRIVSPESLARVGACADSGYSITADQGFAYLCDRWGLYIVDATNTASPRRASTITGQQTGAAWAEGDFCYYTETGSSTALAIANVANPYSPSPAGRRTGIGGYDIYKLDFYAYVPGYSIADVSDPYNIGLIGDLGYGGNGVWTRSPFSYSFLAAGSDGLATVNISDPVHPALDTILAGADISHDITAAGGFAYVANDYCGMKSLDLRTISAPREVGSYDSTGQAPQAHAVAVRDSFAYLHTWGWLPTAFRTIDVSDPTNPRLAATCRTGFGAALAIRDSFAYVAANYHLDIISIANPRAPRLVGSCGLPTGCTDLHLVDTLAYVTTAPVSVVNIKDPVHPAVTAEIPTEVANGVFARDTLLYVAKDFGGLEVWSVADLAAPRLIDTVFYPGGVDVLAVDSVLYFGGYDLRVLSLADPAHPVEFGHYATPHNIRRLFWSAPYVYAACFGAGVCILETTTTAGITESERPRKEEERVTVWPNPATSDLRLTLPAGMSRDCQVQICDLAGRVIKVQSVKEKERNSIDIRRLPEGCYFIEVKSPSGSAVAKFVKSRQR